LVWQAFSDAGTGLAPDLTAVPYLKRLRRGYFSW
jgi:hypothetical protein